MGITEEQGVVPYSMLEVVWGVILLLAIFSVNIAVLWVVCRSRELWKPRHLWMACLCITDIFIGGHKALELSLFFLPYRELCVIQRATLGIPYVVNMLLLSLLSLDRFMAVHYPLFYVTSVSNKYVLIGFIIVLLTGGPLTVISISMGLRDPICRAPSLQLVYITIILTICSVIMLFLNCSVLRIAREQLNAIYAKEPAFQCSRRRRQRAVVSKKESIANILFPIPKRQSSSQAQAQLPRGTSITPPGTNAPPASNLPLADAMEMGILDLDPNLKTYNSLGQGDDLPSNMSSSCEPKEATSSHLQETGGAPLVRAASLPTIPDPTSVQNSLVVQGGVLGNLPADVNLGGKKVSMTPLERASCGNVPMPHIMGGASTLKTATLRLGSVVAGPRRLPRSRSFMTCRAPKDAPQSPTAPRSQLIRNIQFARTVGRLYPSIRFARTVLLIMVPMWVFILPIVTIIPLHQECEAGNKAELNCQLVGTLWRYLFVHLRSILPLQAIIDTLIYVFGSKEFQRAGRKLVRRIRQPKHKNKR